MSGMMEPLDSDWSVDSAPQNERSVKPEPLKTPRPRATKNKTRPTFPFGNAIQVLPLSARALRLKLVVCLEAELYLKGRVIDEMKLTSLRQSFQEILGFHLRFGFWITVDQPFEQLFR